VVGDGVVPPGVVVGAWVVVVVVVRLPAAVCMNASMVRSAIEKDTTMGPTNAPVPISRLRVARLLSSSPSRADLRFGLLSSISETATLRQPMWNQLGYSPRAPALFVDPRLRGRQSAPYSPLIVQYAVDALHGAVMVAQRQVETLGAAHQCGNRPDRGAPVDLAHSQFRDQGLGHHHRRHMPER
jgi:hypothetical protein